MTKRKFLTFILTGILVFSCMTLVVPHVQAAAEHKIVLPFDTSWENEDPYPRTDSVDSNKSFSSPECRRVLNEVDPPDVYGYDFGDWQLKAAGQFDSSNSYCYFNLFDMTPDSDWGPPIKIRPYTFINVWYYHDQLAHSMIDAQLFNQRTGKYWTLRDFYIYKRINGISIYEYIVDQNGVRIHPGYRYNDTHGSWQFASFDLSIIYEDDPGNWYITKIWIGFDNTIDPNHPTGQARTYFDMLYISYGAGNRQVTKENEPDYYYNAWTTGSIITRRYDRDPNTGTYDLELKVAISAFNDGYTIDKYGNPEDPIRPYKLRVSTTAGKAEFLDYPGPTGLNLTQLDPGKEEVEEFVLDVLIIIVSLKYAEVGLLFTASELASVFSGLTKMPDPNKTTYEWPHGVGWHTYGDPFKDLPELIQGEVVLKISGLSSGEIHTIPITFEVDYCYTPEPLYGLYPVLFRTESFTLNITWTTTPDDVNLPPETPSTPSGPEAGCTGITYVYSTSTKDPENDTVRYKFIWGDGTTYTTGWRLSGRNVSVSHTWTSPGTYYVKVRAQDYPYGSLNGYWSDWSPPLKVIIDPNLTMILNELGFTNIEESTVETFSPGTYEVKLYAEFAGYHESNNLSWYPVGTTNYNLIFSGTDGGFGYVDPPTTATFTANDEFGLSFQSPEGRYFTETSRNPDGLKHAQIYVNLDNPDMYLIGFENKHGGGDKDYNDMVISLELVSLTVLAEDQYNNPLTTGDVYIDGELVGYTGSTFTVETGTHTVFVNDF